VQLAKHQQRGQQQPGPIQVEIVGEGEEMRAKNGPTMVTASIFANPNEEVALLSCHTILKKTRTNNFDPSNLKLHEHVKMISATKCSFCCILCLHPGYAHNHYN
jgi:hypothetical protein